MVTFQELGQMMTPSLILNPRNLRLLSPLAHRIEREEDHLHTGVKAFLRYLKKKRWLGRSLREDLIALHNNFVALKRIYDTYRGAKNSHDLELIKQTKSEFFRQEVFLDLKCRELLDDLTKCEISLASIANKLKVFQADEKELKKILETVLPNNQFPYRSKLLIITNYRLEKVIPFFETVANEFSQLQSTLSGLIQETKKWIVESPSQQPVDFGRFLSASLAAEKVLENIINDAERLAKDEEDKYKSDNYTLDHFVQVVEKMLEARISHKEELKL